MKTFHIGGIHLADNKISSNEPVINAPCPEHAIILLNQHLGAPAVPVVSKGDKVKAGQLIAKANGYVSANVHASVSGTVRKIEKVADASGYGHEAIFIDSEGDEWIEGIDLTSEIIREIDLQPAEIIDRIKQAGIVGMGGACFPTHVKLNIPEGKKADVVIVNAAECEPYITADHRLLLEKGEEILIGLRLLMKAVGVDRGVVGIENNKMDAAMNLRELASLYPGIEIMTFKAKYPQGGEKQIIESVTGRRVPSGALPVDVGAIVQNAATVYAVYEAVQKRKPLVERVVTVTGESVNRPGNFLVRIGTPFSDLTDLAGGVKGEAGKFVSGGPMMGKAMPNLSVPVTKGSSCLLVMSENDALRKEQINCIRCGKCIEACPMGLEPFLLMNLAEESDLNGLEKEHIMDCIECGCCTYSCPSCRPLIDYLKMGKLRTGEMIRARRS